MNRGFQFSLRSLLMALTVGCVWFGRHVDSAMRQRQAVVRIGHPNVCFYSYQADVRQSGLVSLRNSPHPPAPKWMIDLLGVDFFSRVTVLILEHNGDRVADDALGGLDGLEFLSIHDTDLDARFLEHVKRIPRLRWLVVHGNRPMNREELANLQRLLPNCQVATRP